MQGIEIGFTVNGMRNNSAPDSHRQTMLADADRKIVLEARGLGKTYGSGKRSVTVFQQVNLALQA
jgi:hypothetical protein